MLATTILGSSMAFIDGTVVNVALPALQNAMHASIADVQWVVESYALLLAALLLVGGSLGDTFGRRKVYVVGVAIFAASSAWCGRMRAEKSDNPLLDFKEIVFKKLFERASSSFRSGMTMSKPTPFQ